MNKSSCIITKPNIGCLQLGCRVKQQFSILTKVYCQSFIISTHNEPITFIRPTMPRGMGVCSHSKRTHLLHTDCITLFLHLPAFHTLIFGDIHVDFTRKLNNTYHWCRQEWWWVGVGVVGGGGMGVGWGWLGEGGTWVGGIPVVLKNMSRVNDVVDIRYLPVFDRSDQLGFTKVDNWPVLLDNIFDQKKQFMWSEKS